MCRCCPGTPQQALSVHADLAVGTGSHHHHCRSETKIEGAGQFIGFYQRQQSLKLDVIITFYRTYLNFPAAHQQFETTFQQIVRPRIQLRNQALILKTAVGSYEFGQIQGRIRAS
jgi:hypothetical protein